MGNVEPIMLAVKLDPRTIEVSVEPGIPTELLQLTDGTFTIVVEVTIPEGYQDGDTITVTEHYRQEDSHSEITTTRQGLAERLAQTLNEGWTIV